MMKNALLIITGFVIGFFVMLVITTNAYGLDAPWTDRQVKSHSIAQTAREMGLMDDNPIIKEASRIWWEEQAAADQKRAEAEADEEFLQSHYTDAVMMARVMYCEAKCIADKRELSMIAWTILNRLDAGYGNSIPAVITAHNQFAYRKSAPTVNQCGVDLLALAQDVLLRWQDEREGKQDVGRTLPKAYCYYYGDGHHNYFRTSDRGRGYLWFDGYGDPYV